MARAENEQVAELSSPRGRMVVSRPAPGVVVVTGVGKLEASIAAGVKEALEAALRDAVAVQLLVDFERVTGYDSEIRVSGTTALLRHRDRLQGFHVLTRSKVVRMGIQVAAMVLSMQVTVYSERRAYTIALKGSLQG